MIVDDEEEEEKERRNVFLLVVRKLIILEAGRRKDGVVLGRVYVPRKYVEIGVVLTGGNNERREICESEGHNSEFGPRHAAAVVRAEKIRARTRLRENVCAFYNG